jgi:2',3'-cyclic-nucleotide 2'-phosphodiesterase (5'-nucleotidase family)
MVPMVTTKMKTQIASAYLWDPPIEVATTGAEELRPNVDALFVLSHIGYRQDLELAKTGIFDAIFGGHSHTVLNQPELVGKTWIAQGGSHNRFAGRYIWDGTLHGELLGLPASYRASSKAELSKKQVEVVDR